MGRGKIEIKKIENPTNRQVTYSKRRSGIMKKAKELTVLCDAQVSIIMFSSTNKFSEYCSPSTNTKSMYDRYQQATNVDLWTSQYERMQNNLNHLNEINSNLRKEIRQRSGGGDLEDMDIDQLRGLEQNLEAALKEVRGKKYHVIHTRTETYKKKFKNSQEAHRNLLRQLDMKDEQPIFGFVDEGPANYDGAALGLANGGGPNMYAFRVQPSQPNLQGMGYHGSHDLRLG